MRKTLVLIFALASVAAFAYPVREDLAGKAIEATDNAEPLPYGAISVQYIESDGNQYIEVGTISGVTAVEAVVSTSVEPPDSGAYKAFGVGRNSNFNDDFGVDIYGWCGTLLPVQVDTFVSVRYEYYRRYVNNTLIGGTPRWFFQNANKGNKLFLFCGTTGTTPLLNKSGNYMAWRGRIAFFEVFANQASMVRLQPVRFPNEMDEWEGAMYDFVSGELFRNAGTGSFIIGPDL